MKQQEHYFTIETTKEIWIMKIRIIKLNTSLRLSDINHYLFSANSYQKNASYLVSYKLLTKIYFRRFL